MCVRRSAAVNGVYLSSVFSFFFCFRGVRQRECPFVCCMWIHLGEVWCVAVLMIFVL